MQRRVLCKEACSAQERALHRSVLCKEACSAQERALQRSVRRSVQRLCTGACSAQERALQRSVLCIVLCTGACSAKKRALHRSVLCSAKKRAQVLRSQICAWSHLLKSARCSFFRRRNHYFCSLKKSPPRAAEACAKGRSPASGVCWPAPGSCGSACSSTLKSCLSMWANNATSRMRMRPQGLALLAERFHRRPALLPALLGHGGSCAASRASACEA